MPAHTVRNGAADLAVTEWVAAGADPAAAPIVALHPGVGDRRIWGDCAPAWAAAGHRVLAYDRRGFGDTATQPEPHDDVADLLAVMDAHGVERAVLVGNSMGGGLALDAAVAHPDRVLGLVLIGAMPSGAPFDKWVTDPAEAAMEERYKAADASGDLAAVNRVECHYWLDGPRQDEGRVTGAARALFLDMNGRALAAGDVGPDAERPEAWPALGDVAVPTLWVLGEHDEVGFAAIVPLAAEAMPNARVVTLGDTAHCPQLDQPDALNDAVLSLLAELP